MGCGGGCFYTSNVCEKRELRGTFYFFTNSACEERGKRKGEGCGGAGGRERGKE